MRHNFEEYIMKNIAYLFIALMSLMTTQSFATLGGSSASAQIDRVKLNAAKHELSSNSQLYNVDTYEVAPKINIREYVSKTGIVFGVSWNGPMKPDLRQLLGQYNASLTAEFAKRPRRGRSPVYIKRPDVVIESNGHPRYFFGRAYIPAAIPRGVLESEIQ
jgi:hypothetical protein